MKALIGAFNQEKALVGVFSVIVKSSTSAFTFQTLLRHYAKQALTHGSFEALVVRSKAVSVK